MFSWFFGLAQDFADVLLGAVSYVWEFVKDLLHDLALQVIDFALSFMPPSVVLQVNGAQGVLDDLVATASDVNFFIPLDLILPIMLTTILGVGAIRLARWVLSLVPTVNLGG